MDENKIRFFSVKVGEQFEKMYLTPTKEEAEELAVKLNHFTKEELESPDYIMTDVTEEHDG